MLHISQIALASSLEGVIWLVFGLIWVAAQLFQRSLRKNQRTHKPPALPSLPGDAENRDLDDFLAEMLERSAPEMQPEAPPPRPTPAAPQVPHPAARPVYHRRTGKTPGMKISLPARPAPAPVVAAAKPGRTAAKALAMKAASAKAAAGTLAQRVQAFQTGAALRNAALPAMPAMQPQPFTNRAPHGLTASLKSAAGMRRAILWREVVDKPRALQPY